MRGPACGRRTDGPTAARRPLRAAARRASPPRAGGEQALGRLGRGRRLGRDVGGAVAVEAELLDERGQALQLVRVVVHDDQRGVVARRRLAGVGRQQVGRGQEVGGGRERHARAGREDGRGARRGQARGLLQRDLEVQARGAVPGVLADGVEQQAGGAVGVASTQGGGAGGGGLEAALALVRGGGHDVAGGQAGAEGGRDEAVLPAAVGRAQVGARHRRVVHEVAQHPAPPRDLLAQDAMHVLGARAEAHVGPVVAVEVRAPGHVVDLGHGGDRRGDPPVRIGGVVGDRVDGRQQRGAEGRRPAGDEVAAQQAPEDAPARELRAVAPRRRRATGPRRRRR